MNDGCLDAFQFGALMNKVDNEHSSTRIFKRMFIYVFGWLDLSRGTWDL